MGEGEALLDQGVMAIGASKEADGSGLETQKLDDVVVDMATTPTLMAEANLVGAQDEPHQEQ